MFYLCRRDGIQKNDVYNYTESEVRSSQGVRDTGEVCK